MITVVKVWQAKCDTCGLIIESRDAHVDLMLQGVLDGWLFQYQQYQGIPRYRWAAYCPNHVGDCPVRIIPDDLRCGITRMREAIARLTGLVDRTTIERRVR
jgi:hypothetical protein